MALLKCHLSSAALKKLMEFINCYRISILGPKKFLNLIWKWIIILNVCIILSEKITGGPRGPLPIIYFFKKKKKEAGIYKTTNKKVRSHTLNKGPRLRFVGILCDDKIRYNINLSGSIIAGTTTEYFGPKRLLYFFWIMY